jgi:hypothetical protein
MHPPDDLRLCTSCELVHYENCSGCNGFGVLAGGEREPANIYDALAHRRRPFGTMACPLCGSTIKGPPLTVTFFGGPRHRRIETHPRGSSPLFLSFPAEGVFGPRHYYEKSGDAYLYVGQRAEEYEVRFD